MLRTEERGDSEVELKDIMVGYEASANRSYLDISYPMENGIIRNFEDMLHVWDYAFQSLKIQKFHELGVLLTEAPLNPLKNREKMCEVMLEHYGFHKFHVATQAVLTLYAQGLMTGVVIDSGDGVTHIIPVYEGHVITHLIKRLDVAGRSVTKYLIKLLQLRGYNFNRSSDFESVQKIKEKLCYVSYDLNYDKKLSVETTILSKSYTLPDGRNITIANERFEAPECLFQPYLVDIEGKGMAELLVECVQSADIDLRADLYKHIVLSGGSSMYSGLPSRLTKEIKQIYTQKVLKNNIGNLKNFKINVDDSPSRKNMVFIGGAVLAQAISNNQNSWVTKEEWEELGPKALQKFNNGI